MIKNKRILITGGTGSLGKELVRKFCLKNEMIVYSRNEERQYEMQQEFKEHSGYKNISYKIGDVRDTDTLQSCLYKCDIAIHAAAMKDLIMCETQPTQTYLNNIEGSKSFINAVKNTHSVTKAVGISTDKAASPSSVYGASKYIMEQLFNEAARTSSVTFFSVRFGNMINSRGSLIQSWKKNPKQEIKLTHPEISRFFFTCEEAALTVEKAIETAKSGDIMIRKMKQAKIKSILTLITGRKNFEIIGLFPGEKVHEELMSENESQYCVDIGDYFVIRQSQAVRKKVKFSFSSANAEELTENELKKMIGIS